MWEWVAVRPRKSNSLRPCRLKRIYVRIPAVHPASPVLSLPPESSSNDHDRIFILMVSMMVCATTRTRRPRALATPVLLRHPARLPLFGPSCARDSDNTSMGPGFSRRESGAHGGVVALVGNGAVSVGVGGGAVARSISAAVSPSSQCWRDTTCAPPALGAWNVVLHGDASPGIQRRCDTHPLEGCGRPTAPPVWMRVFSTFPLVWPRRFSRRSPFAPNLPLGRNQP